MLNYSGKRFWTTAAPFAFIANDTEKGTSFSPSALYNEQLCNPAHSPGYSLNVEWWLVDRLSKGLKRSLIASEAGLCA